jgi:hypothetical protein
VLYEKKRSCRRETWRHREADWFATLLHLSRRKRPYRSGNRDARRPSISSRVPPCCFVLAIPFYRYRRGRRTSLIKGLIQRTSFSYSCQKNKTASGKKILLKNKIGRCGRHSFLAGRELPRGPSPETLPSSTWFKIDGLLAESLGCAHQPGPTGIAAQTRLALS